MRRPRFMGANKYHATKIDSADGKFDSALEYKRWVYLKCLEAEGTIKNLVRQVPYTLIPTQYKNGKVLYRETKYVSDMEYDVVKQKMMFYVFGVQVRVVKSLRGGQWVIQD